MGIKAGRVFTGIFLFVAICCMGYLVIFNPFEPDTDPKRTRISGKSSGILTDNRLQPSDADRPVTVPAEKKLPATAVAKAEKSKKKESIVVELTDDEKQTDNAVLIGRLSDYAAAASMNPDEVFDTTSILIATRDEATFNQLISIYRTSESIDFSRELLRAFASTSDSELNLIYAGHLEVAVAENDEMLVSALSAGLANMGDEKSVKVLRNTMASSETVSEDMPYIIGQTLINVHDVAASHVLTDIVRERLPGYEGAIKALLSLGDAGVNEIAELVGEYAVQDQSDFFDTLDKVISEIEYDEEMYDAFMRLSMYKSEYDEIFLNILNRLDSKRTY